MHLNPPLLGRAHPEDGLQPCRASLRPHRTKVGIVLMIMIVIVLKTIRCFDHVHDQDHDYEETGGLNVKVPGRVSDPPLREKVWCKIAA